MDSSNPSVASACAHRSKPALRICAGCRDAPVFTGGVHSIYYCSSNCQVADWTTLKMVCKGLKYRKMLYRAGDTLQQFFYLYRERMFDTAFVKVEEKDGKLYFYEKDMPTKLEKDVDALTPFPHELCTSVENKQAMLVLLCAGDAVAWFHLLFKYFLSGITSSTTEICVDVKNPYRETVVINIQGTVRPHSPHVMLLVTLKQSGEKYTVDLAGAQYGFHQPITSWPDFKTQHVVTGEGAAPIQEESFGDRRGSFLRAIFAMAGCQIDRLFKLNLRVSMLMSATIGDWEEHGNMKVKALLDLSGRSSS